MYMYLYITNSVYKTKSSKYLTVVNSLFFVPALCGSLSLFCKVNITSEFFSRVKLQGLLLSILTSNFNFFLFSVDVEHSHVRFLGNLVLNLWDCGG